MNQIKSVMLYFCYFTADSTAEFGSWFDIYGLFLSEMQPLCRKASMLQCTVYEDFTKKHVKQYRAIQSNTIQKNTIQYKAIQYNTKQYNTIQCITKQYNTIQYNT